MAGRTPRRCACFSRCARSLASGWRVLLGINAVAAILPAQVAAQSPAGSTDVAGATASRSPGPQPSEQAAAWQTAPATRRGGFTAGLLGGLALGAAHGYPNEFAKIDNSAYYNRTSGPGAGGALWIGGALTDWFTFALGGGASRFGGQQLSSSSYVFLFHLEAFPLFYRGGALRDLGAFADFGTGVGSIVQKSGAGSVAKAGSFSVGGAGVFWEGWRAAHLAAGPVVAWQYQGSDPMMRQFGLIGLRGVLYGGP